jgi:hypothetical protein
MAGMCAGSAGGLVADPPGHAHQHEQEHRHARPFVPGIELQLGGRQVETGHVEAEAEHAEDHQCDEPVQNLGGGGVVRVHVSRSFRLPSIRVVGHAFAFIAL